VPTNNEAESALRKAVLWRKGSFGINSEAGGKFVERILTMGGTTRRRGVDLLDLLTRAIQAELNGVPPPALA
jgi:transposase